MRLLLIVALISTCAAVCLPDLVDAEESSPRPEMRQLVSAAVKQRWTAPVTPATGASASHDSEVVTLPAVLVSAAIVRVPEKQDTVRRVVGVVQVVQYGEFANRDVRLQSRMHELLDLADLAGMSGDQAVGDKIRRETYRSLVRDPTPLERAMDRSANGGRY